MSKKKHKKKLSTEKKIEYMITVLLSIAPILTIILEYIKYFSK